ncbi:MAG: hypothetical protein PQJ58_12325 [Spirochaetales bacterium]|nr:hypothetical protein [Spirochaetales bacterium]
METKDIPQGDKITIRPSLILDRQEISSEEMMEIQEKGSLKITKTSIFELDAQGLTIARGKLIKKRGKYYFKITEMAGEK